MDKIKRVTIIAKGEVQKVGYRNIIEKIARKLQLTGYVENLEGGDVKIVVEGKRNELNEFIEKIKISKFPIFVEKIETSFTEPTKEFKYFKIKRGDWREEFGERFDVAGTLHYRSVELGEKSVALGEKNLKKLDNFHHDTIQRFDKLDDSFHSFHQDTVQRFDTVDVKYGKISENMDKIDETLNKLAEATLKLAEKVS